MPPDLSWNSHTIPQRPSHSEHLAFPGVCLSLCVWACARACVCVDFGGINSLRNFLSHSRAANPRFRVVTVV